jgi:hypothetical protein
MDPFAKKMCICVCAVTVRRVSSWVSYCLQLPRHNHSKYAAASTPSRQQERVLEAQQHQHNQHRQQQR